MCLYFTKSEPIFKPNTNLTRGARGIAKPNRTLVERGDSNKESGTLCVLSLAPCGARPTTTPRHHTRSTRATARPKPFPFNFLFYIISIIYLFRHIEFFILK
ncbi:MAG: hypothetical protein V1768_01495 [Patescibacteria group bacterium]|nr:hypothetical protein [Patescibacteria group bacterium]MBU1349913.1 hypothetical protein [Patescibacteria group bacterium]MBU1421115.1 hypothetical protein [Patescibacteria group bacterium]MBU1778650.1 hypothetical protein [Patescibacteria group bacterium]MBU1987664.1 hypothetical protein [Patescibacteria group bacterium]